MHDNDGYREYANCPPYDILMALEAYYLQAQNVLSHRKISPVELQVLTDMVVQVRNILAQWEEAENRLRQNMQLAGFVVDMKSKYLALEGRVKEIRNDLVAK